MSARRNQIAVLACLASAACGLVTDGAFAAERPPAPEVPPAAEVAVGEIPPDKAPATDPAAVPQPDSVPTAETALEPADSPVALPSPAPVPAEPSALPPAPATPSAFTPPRSATELPRHRPHSTRGSAEARPSRRRPRRSQQGRPVYLDQAPTSPEQMRGAGSQGIAAGDFDGDGDVDLAVPHYYGGMTVLLNKGNGDFRQAASSPHSVGEFPRGVAAGDFDGDMDLDLAVSNFPNEGPGYVQILLNDGGATFRSPPGGRVLTGAAPYGLAADDLDGDGDLDLAVANQRSSDVTILLNDGHASFSQRPGEYEQVAGGSFDLALGDFDADGDLDLVVARNYGPGIAVLFNDGNAQFEQFVDGVPETDAGAPIAVADVDVDGDLDVIRGGQVFVLVNDGAGRFTGSQMKHHGVATVVAAGDLDGDGDPDLVYAWANSIFSGPGEEFLSAIGILLNDGSGHFHEPPQSPMEASNGPEAIALADLDGDGDLDAAVGTDEDVQILLNVQQAPADEPADEPSGEPRRPPETERRRHRQAEPIVAPRPVSSQVTLAVAGLAATGYETGPLFGLGWGILVLGGLLARLTRRV